MSLTRINNLGITDGTIVNADINSAAAIATTKLGAGAVLQVVTVSDSTERTTTSTSFVTSTGLSLSITPSSASNKIFLVSSYTGYNNTAPEITFNTLYRNSTNLGASNGFSIYRASSSQNEFPITMTHLDSPSSTSAITYAVYFKVSAGTGIVNKGSTTGTLTAFEIKG